MPGLFDKWKDGLEKTRKTTFGRISTLLGASEINISTWDELEAIFLQADIGIETTEDILKSLKQKVREQGVIKASEFQPILKTELIDRLEAPVQPQFDQFQPTVILLVGVNGSGKTTTAAKLGRQFSRQGKKVMFAAADTYRAAAVDQLQVWADRINLPVIIGAQNADPGAVTYDAIQAAISRKMDILLVDTAGRLHTRYNLMEELKKVYRVASKAMPGAPHLVWLVLDATTGQNAMLQARAFKDAVKVNAIILAKLDSSARGGMAFAIHHELGLPIIFAGLGEKPEDLQPFDRNSFVEGILTTK